MALPPLNANGFLPPGVHTCTYEEIRSRFGTFQSSDRRTQLFDRLSELLNAARRSGLFRAMVINGSFTTRKPEPEDIDVILVLDHDHDWRADLPAADYGLVSRIKLRRRFGFDVFVGADGDPNYERYVEFFGRVREDTSARKGMLRIEI